jgi:hypothetical protein
MGRMFLPATLATSIASPRSFNISADRDRKERRKSVRESKENGERGTSSKASGVSARGGHVLEHSWAGVVDLTGPAPDSTRERTGCEAEREGRTRRVNLAVDVLMTPAKTLGSIPSLCP